MKPARFPVFYFVFVAVVLATIIFCAMTAQIKISLEDPTPGVPTALFEIKIETATPSPEPSIRFETGMEAPNRALAKGECPDPELIPTWIDFKDPKDPSGQTLCPKTAPTLEPFPPGVTSP